MATTQFLLEKLVVDSTAYKGLGNLSLSDGIQSTLNAGGSELDPSLLATAEIVPAIEFTTFDVGTWLPALFGGSRKLPHLPISSSAQFYLQATAQAGTRGGAGTNIKINATKGVFYPLSIASARGVAALRMRFEPNWDGTNAPLTFTTSQDLAAGGAGSPSLWVLRALKIATTVINRGLDFNLDFGLNVQRLRPSNTLYAMDSTIVAGVPRLAWATTDIATQLAATGHSLSASGSGGIQLYLGQYDDDTASVLTTGAMALVLRAGSPYWAQSIDLEPDAICRVQCGALGLGGDTFATDQPLTLSTSQTLPSEGATAAEYRPGRIVLDASALDYQRAGIDFGLDIEAHGPGHLPWMVYATIKRREPTLRIALMDPATQVATVGLGGVDVASELALYLRKQAAQGEAVADGSGVHIKISAADGRVEPASLGGAHNELQRGDLIARPVGGLTISTTSTTA